MVDPMNPFIPASYDIIWSAFALVGLLLAVAALVSISRVAKQLTITQALFWTLFTIFVLIVGPLSWFAIGRRSVKPLQDLANPAHPRQY